MPSRPLSKGHSRLICVARSLLGRKTRGGGGAGTGAGRAGRAGMFPPGRGRRTRAGNCVRGRAASGSRRLRAGRQREGPRRAEPGRGDPPPPQARRCPHARAVAASAAPAPCPASAAAAGGPQNPGRIWRGRGRAAAEVGAARDGGKSRRSGVGSKVCGAGRLFSRIAHVACGRGAGAEDS
ncbi:oleosin-B6-like isoform X2 [Sus scrofa]|uniref:oleosin-B6-like isoform X2 n=1 Tax=Sus scrofa TaxID=9823 RepID=UPI000A2B7912|nr:oleosin-B6-like isoform X2 [Sus scrofa]